MSMETLKADLKANLAALAALDPITTTPADLLSHLRNSLWPTLEAMSDEMTEIDDCVADIIHDSDDIIQPETAETFAAIIAGATVAVAALRTKITKESDPGLWKTLEELAANCRSGTTILEEAALPDDEPDGENDDEDDDEDDATEGAQP